LTATINLDAYRVLVVAPTRRDDEATRELLARAQIVAESCAGASALIAQIDTSLGAVVLTDAIFREPHVADLMLALSRQPPWSDIPLILLCLSGPQSPLAVRSLRSLSNVTILERPTSSRTLVSSVQAALRARKRQYEMREQFEAIRRSEGRLRETESALREADQRKDLFLATLAHELRNPLAPIRAAVQLLAAPQLPPHKVEWIRSVIQRQARHMALLLDDLLDVARVTQGKLVLKPERVSLAQVVEAAVETARPTIDEKHHELTVSLPSPTPMLDADSLRISQVLTNLLTNAAKYTNAGGSIQLVGKVENDLVCVTVQDNGIGIPAESLPRIFEMFSQVDVASERSGGGLGIGLSLVKGLVDLHGGTIEAYSEGLGLGSTFIVRLPLAATSSQLSEQNPMLDALSPQTGSLRILIADDNRDAADSLALLLSLAGHEVRVAHDGRAALDLAGTFHPDVAILDIGMPQLDGYEVAQGLRQAGGPAICLIALTGRARERDRQRASAAGFNHYQIKPIDPKELQGIIALGCARQQIHPARTTPANPES
jgi:signal transduction histidine kinase/ActR/RegA family two-component response regulator